MPQMLSFEICRQIRRILTGDSEYPYINESLAVGLRDKRQELGDSLRRSALAVRIVPGKAHVWTFAGGRINQTLKCIFAVVGGFEVSSDNFQLRIEGDNVSPKAFNEVIHQMRKREFWTDKNVWDEIVATLPEYRLSKFQPALPPRFAAEMVMEYLLFTLHMKEAKHVSWKCC